MACCLRQPCTNKLTGQNSVEEESAKNFSLCQRFLKTSSAVDQLLSKVVPWTLSHFKEEKVIVNFGVNLRYNKLF